MSKTYIHHQGFVYGPVTTMLSKPMDKKEYGIYTAIYESDVMHYENNVLSLRKFKWTGPELPDWSEVVEGVDFIWKGIGCYESTCGCGWALESALICPYIKKAAVPVQNQYTSSDGSERKLNYDRVLAETLQEIKDLVSIQMDNEELEAELESLKKENEALKERIKQHDECSKCAEREAFIIKEPLAFLLTNALRLLNNEKMKSLADALYDRLPLQIPHTEQDILKIAGDAWEASLRWHWENAYGKASNRYPDKETYLKSIKHKI